MREENKALTNLLAGGGAGIAEALACHPLDTIKTRMQLQRKSGKTGPRLSFVSTGSSIITKEGFFSLYNGLSAVVLGMGPKMAIRFTSFEIYKELLPHHNEASKNRSIFLAGLAAGVTEAVSVVNPMEVLKIRLQSWKTAPAAAVTGDRGATMLSGSPNLPTVFRNTVEHEGISALYRGVGLTAVRQGTNQAVNFTVYSMLQRILRRHQPDVAVLPSWQTASIGLVSGAMGPLCNAPIDTIKTRMQTSKFKAGHSKSAHVPDLLLNLVRQEGVAALWKGITPRVLRVAPGQAVTFTMYEYLKGLLQRE